MTHINMWNCNQTVPCKKPVDVLFLLKAGNQFEDMKTFVKAFISRSEIGGCG